MKKLTFAFFFIPTETSKGGLISMIVFKPSPDVLPTNHASFVKVTVSKNHLIGCRAWKWDFKLT
jgi:hypothetical protein